MAGTESSQSLEVNTEKPVINNHTDVYGDFFDKYKIDGSTRESLTNIIKQNTAVWDDNSTKSFLQELSNIWHPTEKIKEKMLVVINNLSKYIFSDIQSKEEFKNNANVFVKKCIGTIKTTTDYININQKSSISIPLLTTNEQAIFDKIQLDINSKVKRADGSEVTISEIIDENIKNSHNSFTKEEGVNYIRYQFYLRQKTEQAKTDPTIIVSAEEKANAEGFDTFLKNSGVDTEQFFSSLSLRSLSESSSLAPTTEKADTPEDPKTDKSISNLAAHAGEFQGLKQAVEGLNSPFKEMADKDLMLQMPPVPGNPNNLIIDPTGEHNENLAKSYNSFCGSTRTESDYPLFDSLKDKNQQNSMRTLLWVNQVLQKNPTLTDEQFTNTMKQAKIGLPKGFPSTIEEIKTKANETFPGYIRDHLTVASTAAKERVSQSYLDLIGNFFGQFGEGFTTDPSKIELKESGFMIPCMVGEKPNQVAVQITQGPDGTLRMTNFLADSTNTNNNIIRPGTVVMGETPTLGNYYEQGIEPLKDIKKLSNLLSQSPQDMQSKVKEGFDSAHQTCRETFAWTEAAVRHNLSAIRAQATLLQDVMPYSHLGAQEVHNDPSLLHKPIQQSGSPTAGETIAYMARKQEITSEKDKMLFPLLKQTLNATLLNSADENKRLSDSMIAFSRLSHDTDLDAKLRTTMPKDMTPTNALLSYAFDPTTRTQKDYIPTLMTLLSDKPTDLNATHINLPRLESFVRQLQQIKDGSLDAKAFRCPLDPNNPVGQSLVDKATESKATADLNKGLEGINDDPNTTETYET